MKKIIFFITLFIQILIFQINGYKKHNIENQYDQNKLIYVQNSGPIENNTFNPVIGVLTEPFTNYSFQKVVNNTNFQNPVGFISQDFVSFLEQSGAKILPIRWEQSEDYIKQQMDKVDGVFLQGGGAPLYYKNTTFTEYQIKQNIIIEYGIKINDQGRHFPIYGTCLGYEAMVQYFGCEKKINNKQNCPLQTYKKQNQVGFYTNSIKLQKQNLLKTKVFNFNKNEISEKLLNYLQKNDNAVYFHHNDYLTVKSFNQNQKLQDFFNLVAVSETPQGDEIVSMIEGKQYPIFGTQFHTEKFSYDFLGQLNRFNHNQESVKIGRYLSDQFVEECRKVKYNGCQKQNYNRNSYLHEILEYDNTLQSIHIPDFFLDRLIIFE